MNSDGGIVWYILINYANDYIVSRGLVSTTGLYAWFPSTKSISWWLKKPVIIQGLRLIKARSINIIQPSEWAVLPKRSPSNHTSSCNIRWYILSYIGYMEYSVSNTHVAMRCNDKWSISVNSSSFITKYILDIWTIGLAVPVASLFHVIALTMRITRFAFSSRS